MKNYLKIVLIAVLFAFILGGILFLNLSAEKSEVKTERKVKMEDTESVISRDKALEIGLEVARGLGNENPSDVKAKLLYYKDLQNMYNDLHKGWVGTPPEKKLWGIEMKGQVKHQFGDPGYPPNAPTSPPEYNNVHIIIDADNGKVVGTGSVNE